MYLHTYIHTGCEEYSASDNQVRRQSSFYQGHTLLYIHTYIHTASHIHLCIHTCIHTTYIRIHTYILLTNIHTYAM